MVTTLAGHLAGFRQSASALTGGYRPVAQASSAAYLKPPALVATVPSMFARSQADIESLVTPHQPSTPTSTPAASPAATPAPAPPPLFTTYTIKDGDTVSSIATATGIDEKYILWNNPDVSSNPDLLIVGANLIIPSTGGILYKVRLGDTLTDVAAAYSIDVNAIVKFKGNQLTSPDNVTDGMTLLLPGAEAPAPPPPPPTPAPTDAPAPEPAPPEPAAAPPAPAVSVSAGFIWPWHGGITTYFMENGHKGIDIDGYNQVGAPVVAAASGRVILAAWDNYGYGNMVMIDHGNGFQTRYAHLSRIDVAVGQTVAQGQVIGGIGSTGYSTGPHLHFEVHLNGALVDPLKYLP